MIDWETFKTQLQTNPQKMLKSVLLLAGCLLLIWILVILRNGSPVQQDTIKVYDSGRLSGLDLATGQATDSLAADSPFPQGRDIAQGGTGGELSVLLPMVVVFIVVVGGVWLWFRSKKKKTSPGKVSGDIFTTIASQKLPGGQKLVVVKLNGEYWVMATGGTDGVRLLHRYSSDEWKSLEKRPVKSEGDDSFWQTLKSTASKKIVGVYNDWPKALYI